MATRPDDLNHGKESYTWEAWTDGTITQVHVIDPDGEVVGEGIARRLKGDKRNKELGLLLASARAFRAAARFYEEIAAEEHGYTQRHSLETLIKETLIKLVKDRLK